MSLFKCSIPERRKGEKILPVIPNEIYLAIFEFLRLPTDKRAPHADELEPIVHLSRVCKLFSNHLLPHIFESIELYRDICDDTSTYQRRDYAESACLHGPSLCHRISAKQPLALSLAECVKTCLLSSWDFSEHQICSNPYLGAVSYMTNVRKLDFSSCKVNEVYWQTIASIDSLDELSFLSCVFLEGLADVEPEKRVKVKVSSLKIVDCNLECHPAFATIYPQSLCRLHADLIFVTEMDWFSLSESALTEFRCYKMDCIDDLDVVITQVPRHVETLVLSFGDDPIPSTLTSGELPDVLDHPALKNLTLLRSLVVDGAVDSQFDANTLVSVLGATVSLPSLQSLALDELDSYDIPSDDIGNILQDNVDAASKLTYIELADDVFRLLDGKWTRDHEVHDDDYLCRGRRCD